MHLISPKINLKGLKVFFFLIFSFFSFIFLVTETFSSGRTSWWCSGNRKSSSMWNPHAAETAEHMPVVDIQIPYKIQEDWCYFPNYIPFSFCTLQRSLLVDVSIPRRERRIVVYRNCYLFCSYFAPGSRFGDLQNKKKLSSGFRPRPAKSLKTLSVFNLNGLDV